MKELISRYFGERKNWEVRRVQSVTLLTEEGTRHWSGYGLVVIAPKNYSEREVVIRQADPDTNRFVINDEGTEVFPAVTERAAWKRWEEARKS